MLSPSTVRVAATSWKVTTPEPLLTRACPELLASAVGRVYPAVPSSPISICLLNEIFSDELVVTKVK